MPVITKIKVLLLFLVAVVTLSAALAPSTCTQCQQSHSCMPPDCFCCRDELPLRRQEIPQMVFFTFDDAVTPHVASFYRQLFDGNRKNPNGCSIKMTLFISHANTVYSLVREFFQKGMEIASHSVTHKHMKIDNFVQEARKQKENLARMAKVPESEIQGWRSPFLEPIGDDQPNLLKQLGYKYDATLTISKHNVDDKAPFPFTLDYGWPYDCKIAPCPARRHNGFWEVPVISLLDYMKKYDCVYVDGCNNPPPNEEAAFKFLMDNFNTYYTTNRAPFGINMHASWFFYPDRLKAMDRFIKELTKMNDVYVVSISQVISWLANPTPLPRIDSFEPWQCQNRTRSSGARASRARSAFEIRQQRIQERIREMERLQIQEQQERMRLQQIQWEEQQRQQIHRMSTPKPDGLPKQTRITWQDALRRHKVSGQHTLQRNSINDPPIRRTERHRLVNQQHQQEIMKRKELERQNEQNELLRQKQLEQQQQQPINGQIEKEKRRRQEQELTRQREIEAAKKKQQELSHQKKLEDQRKQQELARQRGFEAQMVQQEQIRQIELEAKRKQEELVHQRELEAASKQLEIVRQRELEAQRQQRELVRRRELEVTRKQQQVARQKELELAQQNKIEAERKQQELMRQKELENQRRQELARQAELIKQEQLEKEKLAQQRLLERQRLEQEAERLLEEQRQQQRYQLEQQNRQIENLRKIQFDEARAREESKIQSQLTLVSQRHMPEMVTHPGETNTMLSNVNNGTGSTRSMSGVWQAPRRSWNLWIDETVNKYFQQHAVPETVPTRYPPVSERSLVSVTVPATTLPPTFQPTTVGRREASVLWSMSDSMLMSLNNKMDMSILKGKTHSFTKTRRQQLRPTATPYVSSGKISSFSTTPAHNRVTRPGSLTTPKQHSSPESCTQGINCKLPSCSCKTNRTPGNIHAEEIPQIVYITIDGDINFHSYSKATALFKMTRQNPNNCRITGTFFASDVGTSYRLTQLLYWSGIEIALNGIQTTPYSDAQELSYDIDEQIKRLTTKAEIKTSDIRGWKSPRSHILGDEQYEVIGNRTLYDSSLVFNKKSSERNIWPFTLDFGWNYSCSTPKCPVKHHPGVWEVPIIPLTGVNNSTCKFVDGCATQPSSETDTYQYLWNNFQTYYNSNRAPFGIRLQQKWFHWYYSDNLVGLEAFIDKILTLKNVYIVSVSKMIDWVKNPTPLSSLEQFQPWMC